MNKACLLKLGMSIQSDSQDMVQSGSGKYARVSDQGRMIAKATDSHLWRSIVKLWPLLEANSLWTVGNGRSIDVCNDIWLEDGLRIADLMDSIHDQLNHMKVHELVGGNGEWNWRLLEQYMSMPIPMRIDVVIPPKDANG